MTRVLIVDDKDENLYYLNALLTAHGCDVRSARHGAEALIRAREEPPDVIISDLLMPVMDGYTLLRHWKADDRLRSVPFIVYTATYTDPEDEQLAHRLGADAFILKPSEPEDFLARLQEVRARPGSLAPLSAHDPEGDTVGLSEYSESLIRKLEQKSVQLEESNRSLQRDMAARAEAERALRESETSFRLLAEAIPQLVWIASGDGSHIYFNQQWVEYTGLSLEESAGDGWSKPFHPEDRPLAERVWKRALESGEAYSTESRLRCSDGSYRWWLLRGVPLRDSTGAVIKWFGTCTDIDELKQAAAQLRRTEEQLRQAQKMEAVGRLAGGLAHDFNNLLSVILGYTSMLLEELDPGSRMREEIQEVSLAGERAAELTRQLLAFSRQQVLQPKVIDLSQVVAGLDKMLRRMLGEDVEVSVSAPRGLGNIYADPSQIEQIVMNLAVNARDAMPRGGSLVIEVASVELDDHGIVGHDKVVPGRYLMLSVTDTGTGMDAATRERIFEPFFTTKEVGKGTGLGLSTVFGIVNQSKGYLAVQSELGSGTTFRIYLPCTDRAPVISSFASHAPPALRGSETLLLVEDDEQVRVMNCAILRRNGYRVLEASDAVEALAASEKFEGKIDLLLVDVVMPRMSGRELAERIAAARAGTKVLYVSGYTEDTVLHHGALAAGIQFLQKPITPDVLLRKVREVLSVA